MPELYIFTKLADRLTECGFAPVVGHDPVGIAINAQELRQAIENGNIRFERNGIHFARNGCEWNGYLYMPVYRVEHCKMEAEKEGRDYDGMPYFHLTNCETIRAAASNKDNEIYHFSNRKYNSITDKDTGQVYLDQTLKLCGKCKKLIAGIDDTKDFFGTLKVNDSNDRIGIGGYVEDWQAISRTYRKNKNYVCESCGLKPQTGVDKKYWRTHHIDGDKKNNEVHNLKCLCALCHSIARGAERTNRNFETSGEKIELDSFIKQYRAQLSEIAKTNIQIANFMQNRR